MIGKTTCQSQHGTLDPLQKHRFLYHRMPNSLLKRAICIPGYQPHCKNNGVCIHMLRSCCKNNSICTQQCQHHNQNNPCSMKSVCKQRLPPFTIRRGTKKGICRRIVKPMCCCFFAECCGMGRYWNSETGIECRPHD